MVEGPTANFIAEHLVTCYNFTELGSIFKTPCNNDSRTRVQQVMRLFYFSEDREVSTAPNGSLWMALLPILEL